MEGPLPWTLKLCGCLIGQDLAVVELVRRVAPALPIHGSTQMSVTSADGAEFARAAGAERIVVGRELSVGEIAQVGTLLCRVSAPCPPFKYLS